MPLGDPARAFGRDVTNQVDLLGSGRKTSAPDKTPPAVSEPRAGLSDPIFLDLSPDTTVSSTPLCRRPSNAAKEAPNVPSPPPRANLFNPSQLATQSPASAKESLHEMNQSLIKRLEKKKEEQKKARKRLQELEEDRQQMVSSLRTSGDGYDSVAGGSQGAARMLCAQLELKDQKLRQSEQQVAELLSQAKAVTAKDQEIEVLKTEVARLEGQLSLAHSELRRVQETVRALQHCEKEAHSSAERVRELQEELQTARGQGTPKGEGAKRVVALSFRKISDLSIRLEEAQASASEAQEKVNHQDTKAQELCEAVMAHQALRGELRAASAKLELQGRDYDALCQEKERSSAELATLRQDLQASEASRAGAVAESAQEAQRQKQRAEQLASELSGTSARASGAEARALGLEVSLRASEATCTALRGRTAALEAELEAAHSNSLGVLQELQAAKEEATARLQDYAGLEQERSAAQWLAEGAVEVRDLALSRVRSVEQQMAGVRREAQRLQAELLTARAEAVELRTAAEANEALEAHVAESEAARAELQRLLGLSEAAREAAWQETQRAEDVADQRVEDATRHLRLAAYAAEEAAEELEARLAAAQQQLAAKDKEVAEARATGTPVGEGAKTVRDLALARLREREDDISGVREALALAEERAADSEALSQELRLQLGQSRADSLELREGLKEQILLAHSAAEQQLQAAEAVNADLEERLETEERLARLAADLEAANAGLEADLRRATWLAGERLQEKEAVAARLEAARQETGVAWAMLQHSEARVDEQLLAAEAMGAELEARLLTEEQLRREVEALEARLEEAEATGTPRGEGAKALRALLIARLREREAQLEETMEKLDVSAREEASLGTMVSVLQEKLSESQEELSEALQDKKQLADGSIEAAESLRALRSDHDSLQESYKSVASQLETAENARAELHAESLTASGALGARLAEAEKETADLRRQLAAAVDAHALLQADAQRSASGLEAWVAEMAASVSRLDQKLSAETAAAGELQAQLANATAAIEEAEAGAARAASDAEGSRAVRDLALARVRQREAQLSAATAEQCRLQEALEEASRAAGAEQSAMVSVLQDRLEDTESANAELRTKERRLSGAVSELEARARELTGQLQGAQAALAEGLSQADADRERLRSAQKEAEDTEAELTARLESLATERDGLLLEVVEAQQLLERKEEEVAEARAQGTPGGEGAKFVRDMALRRIREREAQLAEAATTQADVQLRLQEATSGWEESSASAERLSQQLSEARDGLRSAQERQRQLSSELRQAEFIIDTLRAEADESHEMEELLRSQVDEVFASNTSLREALQQAETDAAHQLQEAQQLTSDLQASLADRKDLQRQLAELSAARTSLAAQLAAAEERRQAEVDRALATGTPGGEGAKLVRDKALGRIREREDQLAEAKEEVERLTVTLEMASSVSCKVQADLQKQQAELEEALAAKQAAGQLLEAAQGRAEDLEARASAAEAELSLVRVTSEGAVEVRDMSLARLKEKEQELSSALSVGRDLEAKLREAKSAALEREIGLQRLAGEAQAESQRLSAELDDARQAAEGLREMQEGEAAFEEALDAAAVTITELQRYLDAKDQETQELKMRLTDTEAALKESEALAERRVVSQKSAQAENTKLERLTQSFMAEASALRVNTAEAEAAVLAERKAREALEEDLVYLNSACQAMEQEVSQLRAGAAVANARVAEAQSARAEADGLRRQLETLVQQSDAAHQAVLAETANTVMELRDELKALREQTVQAQATVQQPAEIWPLEVKEAVDEGQETLVNLKARHSVECTPADSVLLKPSPTHSENAELALHLETLISELDTAYALAESEGAARAEAEQRVVRLVEIVKQQEEELEAARDKLVEALSQCTEVSAMAQLRFRAMEDCEAAAEEAREKEKRRLDGLINLSEAFDAMNDERAELERTIFELEQQRAEAVSAMERWKRQCQSLQVTVEGLSNAVLHQDAPAPEAQGRPPMALFGSFEAPEVWDEGGMGSPKSLAGSDADGDMQLPFY